MQLRALGSVNFIQSALEQVLFPGLGSFCRAGAALLFKEARLLNRTVRTSSSSFVCGIQVGDAAGELAALQVSVDTHAARGAFCL